MLLSARTRAADVNDFFSAALWQELAATFVGAFLALLAHFAIKLRVEKKERSAARAAKTNRLSMYLTMANSAIVKNISLLRQLQTDLPNPECAVFYHLDLGLIGAVLREPLFHYLDFDTAAKLYELNYELEHLQRKLDLHFDLSFRISHAGVGLTVPNNDGGFKEVLLREHLMGRLHPAIVEHLGSSLKMCAEVHQLVIMKAQALAK